MAKLTSPWHKDLTEKDFEQYPLWVWDDGNEGYLPLSDSKFTHEYGTLFIKATFETNQHIFNGYLVGFHSFYAFGIFINNDEAGFNTNFSLPFLKKSSEMLFSLLQCKPFDLFPIKYKSSVLFEDGGPISGIFVLKNGELTCIPDDQEMRRQKLRQKYGKIR